MKLAGLALLLLGALVISREYKRYVKKRLAECEGFISFIKYMRIEMKCFLKPPREIGRGFCDEAISPFLIALEKEESLYSAYTAAKDSFSFTVEEKSALGELFSSIGVCYADDAVRMIDGVLERLSVSREALLTDGMRGVRVFQTVSAAASVGLFILLI